LENPDNQLESGVNILKHGSTPLRQKTQGPSVKPLSGAKMLFVGSLVAVATAVIAVFVFKYAEIDSMSKPIQYDCSQFFELNRAFPNQDKKLFKSLKTGVEQTANGKPPQPTVVSFFSTDSELLDKFLHEIVKITKACLNQTNDPVQLDKKHLSDQLVENYKQQLDLRTIMTIKNIQEADPLKVPALHSFCDTTNPLVSKSIIFVTVTVPEAPTGKPVEYLTEYLNHHWNSVEEHKRTPLITRVVDQTFFLEP